MKANSYDVINEPIGHHRQTPRKAIEAIIQNGADAVTLREAAKSGIRMRAVRQALKLHAQVSR